MCRLVLHDHRCRARRYEVAREERLCTAFVGRMRPMGRLDDVDLSLELGKQTAAATPEKRGNQLKELRLTLGGKLGDGRLGSPVCIVFEGWDASGKGGAIKRLVPPLDMRHIPDAQLFGASDG